MLVAEDLGYSGKDLEMKVCALHPNHPLPYSVQYKTKKLTHAWLGPKLPRPG